MLRGVQRKQGRRLAANLRKSRAHFALEACAQSYQAEGPLSWSVSRIAVLVARGSSSLATATCSMPAMRTALAALALLGTASAFVAPTSSNLKLRTSANAPLYSTIDKKTEDVSLSSGGGMFTTSKPEDRRIGQVERAPASERYARLGAARARGDRRRPQPSLAGLVNHRARPRGHLQPV